MAYSLQGRRILVVEDDHDLARVLQDVARLEGAEVACRSSNDIELTAFSRNQNLDLLVLGETSVPPAAVLATVFSSTKRCPVAFLVYDLSNNVGALCRNGDRLIRLPASARELVNSISECIS